MVGLHIRLFHDGFRVGLYVFNIVSLEGAEELVLFVASSLQLVDRFVARCQACYLTELFNLLFRSQQSLLLVLEEELPMV